MQTPKTNLLLTGKRLAICLSICVQAIAVYAQTTPNVVTMPMGNKGRIDYSLTTGTYNISYNGKVFIKDAWASLQISTDVSSKAKADSKVKTTGKRTYSIKPVQDVYGKGTQYIIEQVIAGNTMQQLFNVYPDKSWCIIQVKLIGKQVASDYASPLTTEQVTIHETGDLRALKVPFDNDMWVRYDAQPLQQAGYTGSEVTALYNSENHHGLIIGSLEHTLWKTGIQVQQVGHQAVSVKAYGGFTDKDLTHDKIPHGKVGVNDTVCSSPKMLVGYFDDWRDGMEQYAQSNKATEPPVIFAWMQATPVGWNSWGAMQTKLNIDKAKAVVDYFHDSCKQFRTSDNTLYIDLDSYWDNLVKGGLTGDVSALETFVQYCRSHQCKPGIYWAPFVDWGKYDRKMEGNTDAHYPAAWLKQQGNTMEVDGALALDPTHPGTRARIVQTINRFKEIGFEMIKIDFLGHAALESDHYYDPAITTGMQAYRSGMEFLDSVLDGKMLVYAAISPSMATARYVHMRRIGCDAFSAIDNSEYTMNSTGYGWWQAHLYPFIDADHVVFGNESEGANRARLASALVTGTLITGDDFSEAGKWRATAANLLQNKALLQIINDGKAFRPLVANTGNKGVQLLVKKQGSDVYLAVFNYQKDAQYWTVSAQQLGFKAGANLLVSDLFTGNALKATNTININIPATNAIIYRITTGSK